MDKPRVITLEEHYWDPDVAAAWGGREAGNPATRQKLDDLGEMRIKDMDKNGIDFQVISHGAPAVQRLNAETAIELAIKANDRLRDAVSNNPKRLGGFAILPVQEPQAAADELERSVTKLGMVGAMVHGLTATGEFLDDRRFWPIYERAQALDVPIYVHPAQPDAGVRETYYEPYATTFPSITSAGWGFTVETATQALRLVLSRVFETYPNLKIILGHMGESLPFSLGRIDEAFSRPGNNSISFRDVFCNNFWITTSGHFNTSALLCSIMEMGVDRVMFSVDWPFVANEPGMKWMETIPLCAEDKAKIFSGNAEKLLKI